ncbi:MAG: hypothetical protein ACYS32_14520 [Planctomycetota bacterium]
MQKNRTFLPVFTKFLSGFALFLPFFVILSRNPAFGMEKTTQNNLPAVRALPQEHKVGYEKRSEKNYLITQRLPL